MVNGASVSSGLEDRRASVNVEIVDYHWNIMAILLIHPGEHLADELNELGMTGAELARRLKVPASRVTEILNGRRGISSDTALRLAHFFGTSAEFWLNLQTLYDLRLAQQRTGKEIRSLPRLKPSVRISA